MTSTEIDKDKPLNKKPPVRVAFAHDWLVTYRGGEKVLEALFELFPDAPIFTLFYNSAKFPDSFLRRKIHVPAGLQRLGALRKILLPFLPSLVESFDLSEFDLVISTSSCVAKGVIPHPEAKHISYVHSPMRYAWDQKKHYFTRSIFEKLPIRMLIDFFLSRLRIWDVVATSRVDFLIANSTFVQSRIQRFYRRDSEVLYPPLEERFFRQSNFVKKDYYLAFGAWVPYKRFDIAIETCRRLDRRLIVAGSGPEEKKMRKLADPRVQFVHSPSDDDLMTLIGEAKALLFTGVEDFGLSAVESLALGTPVIAARAGGALDYIEEFKNGVFFEPDHIDSCVHAVKNFETLDWSRSEIQNSAKKFSKLAFQQRFKEIVRSLDNQ